MEARVVPCSEEGDAGVAGSLVELWPSDGLDRLCRKAREIQRGVSEPRSLPQKGREGYSVLW